jgi:3-ketosteroid 9alpha-monooxygenase subunit A
MNGKAREDARPRLPEGSPQMIGNSSVAAYYGPSFMIDELTYNYDTMDVRTTLINCHYPIDENSFVLQYGIIVKKQDGLDEKSAMDVANTQALFVRRGFEQDVAIWKNKARIDNPLLCEEDGPVYQLRRWYEQFYVDVADIEPEMVDRFEYELDTTKPGEVWEKQVQANLAAKAAAQDKTPVR